MRRLLARAALQMYEKALPAFDAWIFHPQRVTLVARFTLMVALAFGMALCAVGVYALFHINPPLRTNHNDWQLVVNVLIMTAGWAGFFYVSLQAGNHFLGWCTEGARAEQNALMAHFAEHSTVEAESEKTLFLLRHRRLDQLGTLYTLWPVEWWLARVLWNEDLQRRLKHRHYDQTLPACAADPHPRARL